MDNGWIWKWMDGSELIDPELRQGLAHDTRNGIHLAPPRRERHDHVDGLGGEVLRDGWCRRASKSARRPAAAGLAKRRTTNGDPGSDGNVADVACARRASRPTK